MGTSTLTSLMLTTTACNVGLSVHCLKQHCRHSSRLIETRWQCTEFEITRPGIANLLYAPY